MKHWEDFALLWWIVPRRIRSEIQRVTASILAEEWTSFELGLKTIPLPLKTGLYPIAHTAVLRTSPKELS